MEKNIQNTADIHGMSQAELADICDVDTALRTLPADVALKDILASAVMIAPATPIEVTQEQMPDPAVLTEAQTQDANPEEPQEIAELDDVNDALAESLVDQLIQKDASDDEQSLQDIEPAAGNDNSSGGGQAETGDAAIARGGFGFQSEINFEPLDPIGAVGPLGPTALQYGANFQFPDPSLIFISDVEAGFDFIPSFITSALVSLDESDSAQPGFPLQVSGDVDVDFGGEGDFPILANGDVGISGAEGGDTLTSGGETVSISSSGGGYTGTLPDGTVIFTLSIDPDTGNFTFELLGPLDHADDGDHDDVLSLTFGISVTDDDGNVITSDITVNINDDGPVIFSRAGIVDEADLSNGPIVFDGQLIHSFGADGEGEITPTGDFDAFFFVGGQEQQLTSNGQPVTVSVSGNGYVGMVNGVVIFTLTIDPQTGEYTYTQYYAIDHPDTNNPDDLIWLKFEVQITDADGDTDTAQIIIDVQDNDDQGPFPPGCSDGDGFFNGTYHVKCFSADQVVDLDKQTTTDSISKAPHKGGGAPLKVDQMLFAEQTEEVQFFDMINDAGQSAKIDAITKAKLAAQTTVQNVLEAQDQSQDAIEAFVSYKEVQVADVVTKDALKQKAALIADHSEAPDIGVHDVIEFNALLAPEPIKGAVEATTLI